MTSLPSFITDMPPLPPRPAALSGSAGAASSAAAGADFAGLLDAAAMPVPVAVPAAVPVAGASPGPWPAEGSADSAAPMLAGLLRVEDALPQPAAMGPMVLPLTLPAPGLLGPGGNFLPEPGAQLPPALPPSPEPAAPTLPEVTAAAQAVPIGLPVTPAAAGLRDPVRFEPLDEPPAASDSPARTGTGSDAAAPLTEAPRLTNASAAPDALPSPEASGEAAQVEDTGEPSQLAAPAPAVVQAPVAGLPAAAPQPPTPPAPSAPSVSAAALPPTLHEASLVARPTAGGRSELASGPARSTLPQVRAASAPSPAAASAPFDPAPDPAPDPAGNPAGTGASAETTSATPAPASPAAPAAATAAPAAPPAPILAAERPADPAPPAPTLAAGTDAPGARGEAAIDQVGALREALRSARPAMTVQHAEFGAVSLRLEAAAPDQWRAVLASRDPGFVPAIQAALAERALAPASSAADTASHGQHSASQNGTSDQRYGASPNGGQGGSQPYLGQSGQRDGEAAPDHRRPSTMAALAARGEGEAEDPGSRSASAGGLFA